MTKYHLMLDALQMRNVLNSFQNKEFLAFVEGETCTMSENDGENDK